MSHPPVLLGISKWLSWGVEPPSGSSDEAANQGRSLSTVSLERLMQLGLRLRESTPLSGSCHQLLRFNLYNLGDDPVTVSAVALSDTAGQKLQCEVVPPVVVQAGVRYPFMFELRTALGSEAVEIHVEAFTVSVRGFKRRPFQGHEAGPLAWPSPVR